MINRNISQNHEIFLNRIPKKWSHQRHPFQLHTVDKLGLCFVTQMSIIWVTNSCACVYAEKFVNKLNNRKRCSSLSVRVCMCATGTRCQVSKKRKQFEKSVVYHNSFHIKTSVAIAVQRRIWNGPDHMGWSKIKCPKSVQRVFPSSPDLTRLIIWWHSCIILRVARTNLSFRPLRIRR